MLILEEPGSPVMLPVTLSAPLVTLVEPVKVLSPASVRVLAPILPMFSRPEALSVSAET